MEETQEKFPAQWALDLLEPTALDRSNHIFKYYLIPITTSASVLGIIYSNVLSRRPLGANKPYIVLAAIGGALLGYGIHWTADIRFARRDTVMRDYIMRHPERFPEPDVKKYKDIFAMWYPKR